ncbi:hypothetical protein BJY21_001105 [Kineosphaera limosa]|uniref:Uncharacterized protein n=1 Tax=Kineosphaera limosa NBRC 100340 TaxID=1184609 RepID=K6VH61_9MICO|nr:hypothetical protein [Kineosphaera limosa]NYD99920.1 hypothetical protein [Kineosphaera limosa]GAB95543.1 hypothetical protein KILIM_022_00280 [Kineosphaera limosa NBRC 100340]
MSRLSFTRPLCAAVVATLGITALSGVAVATPAANSPALIAPLAAATASTASTVSAASIPSTCRAAVTIVRPDTTLAMGVVQGTKPTVYSTGHQLGYEPTAIAFLGNTKSAGDRVSVDRFLAVDGSGRLHRLTATTRTTEGSASTAVDDTVVATGWGSVRLMVATGPYLYAVTEAGALRRYAISADYRVEPAGVVATSGWGGVRSLAYGGWWKLPGDDVGEDLVAITGSGALTAYVVPRKSPQNVTRRTLASSGWGNYRHVAAGECSTGEGRSLAAVTPSGQVHAFLDADGNDQSGRDIRSTGRVASGWRGLVAD